MKPELPKISNQIKLDDVEQVLEKNFSSLVGKFYIFQLEWMNRSYQKFKDHDKNIILSFLVLKTLNFSANHLTKMSMNEYYSKDIIEIEKFNISDISKNLNISKETCRRKILELENENVIIRREKKITIDRSKSSFGSNAPPIDSIKSVSNVLNIGFKILFQNKILNKVLSSAEIEKNIIENFSYAWKFFLEMQILNYQRWKATYNDLETFHIFSICVLNQEIELRKSLNLHTMAIKRIDYFKKISNHQTQGINAMSISEMSSIPRSTVVRKLKFLLKKKIVCIDKKKLYYVTPGKKAYETADTVTKSFSIFTTKIFNLIML
jgi:predicted transcriptional regulator